MSDYVYRYNPTPDAPDESILEFKITEPRDSS